jgi:uncharacterized protein YeaO (DUF488 family)
MTAARLRVRRIYDEPTPADGIRVLVDRIWPPGVSKTRGLITTIQIALRSSRADTAGS